MTELFEPLSFLRGPDMKNRFMLAPMTNYQSHSDGRLSEDEFRWLTYRAAGGFGLVMTCAAHVQKVGQGFSGQLGIFSDDQLPGLTRLAEALRAEGARSSVQLVHSGIRAPAGLIGGQPRGPSNDEQTGARAMTNEEIEGVIEDFIAAALRDEKAGFDGVELHGAHGYLLCQFLSPQTNRRLDRWGGPLANRTRVLFDIISGVRANTRASFQLGLRLSPERYGLDFTEQREVARWMLSSGDLDYVDLSLWDAFKAPINTAFAAKPLLDWFTDLPRAGTRLAAAGKFYSGPDVRRALDHGLDFAVIGHAGILHHDFPRCIAHDPEFAAMNLPVTRSYLRRERIGNAFMAYLSGRDGFVKDIGADAE